MKSITLVGSLIAILIITVLLWKSIDSVAPSAPSGSASSAAPTQDAMINLPGAAADVTAAANAQVEAMEKAMRETK